MQATYAVNDDADQWQVQVAHLGPDLRLAISDDKEIERQGEMERYLRIK